MDADRTDNDSFVRRGQADLRRRGVRPLDAGRARWSTGPRQSEVEQLDAAIATHLDVGRLQVAVNDTDRVRGVERFGDLHSDGNRRTRRKPSSGESMGEIFAVDQFHDDGVLGHAVGRSRGAFFETVIWAMCG
jgi:hypothetical protein